MRRILAIAAMTVVVGSFAFAIDLLPGKSPAEFLEERGAVLAHLQKQYDADVPGTRHTGPRRIQFEGKTKLKSVRRDHRSNATYQWILNLDEEALPKDHQGNSDTMCATVLLNHYCAGLKDLGYRNIGSPNVAMSKVQCSSNRWFRENDNQIEVTGNVFVAPDCRQAIVKIEIRESFAAR